MATDVLTMKAAWLAFDKLYNDPHVVFVDELKRSALSRLENDSPANRTLLTIERYAAAVVLTASVHLIPAMKNGRSS